jgi:site-specific recombinase XerC
MRDPRSFYGRYPPTSRLGYRHWPGLEARSWCRPPTRCRAVLDDAVRDRLMSANPAAGAKLPTRAKRGNVYLSADQVGLLADEAGRYRSLVLMLGTAGLR